MKLRQICALLCKISAFVVVGFLVRSQKKLSENDFIFGK